MTQAAFGGSAFNTHVDLWLDCEHGRVPLRQVGAEFVIASDPCEIPPRCIASVVISIDGQLHRRKVLLVDGLSADKPMAHMVPCDEDGLPF